MTRRFLIIGAQGQLGSELRVLLDGMQRNGHDVAYVQADVEECDITDAKAVDDFFSNQPSPDVVFNAAAYTDVDGAEEHRQRAMMVNAEGAANVAAAARDVGAALMYFSTDFVFGNGHVDPIDEFVAPQPLSVYGRSKRAGEILSFQQSSRCAVVRTSGLYSRWGRNFVRSIATHARKKKRLKVVDDQWITPTPASTLARVAMEIADTSPFAGGVYHATPHGRCTWREFALAIVELLDIDAEIASTTAEEWGAEARRPDFSVLDNYRLRLRGIDVFEHWREELGCFLGDGLNA